MTRCPDGHESATSDYCDVCGAPMNGAPSAAAGAAESPGAGAGIGAEPVVAPPSPGPVDPGTEDPASTQACPHCGAVNAEANLFCEVCGFDFTTGVMPRVEGGAPSYLPPVEPVQPHPAQGEPTAPPAGDPPPDKSRTEGEPADSERVQEESATDGQLDVDHPAGAETHGDDTGVEAAPDPVETRSRGSLDLPTPEPAGRPDEQASAPAAGSLDLRGADREPERREVAAPSPERETTADPVRTGPRPVNRPPSREVAGDWVVEVWIDPDWYAVQDTDEPCPSVAPPEIVRITGSDALVGRRSRSSVPDVDCGVDSAVSRRQALLTSDGRRWWIEDLDSSNGTWVAPAIGPLPTSPITTRTEIDADDRVYVGAWTRIVLRPAVESEIADG